MNRNIDFRQYFKESMRDENLQRLYREVLEEELAWILSYLRQERGLTQKQVAERLGVSRSRVSQMEVRASLSLSLETLARYAQALGLALRLDFVDEAGEVLARYHLAADEPLAEVANAGWEPLAVSWATQSPGGEKHTYAA